MSLKKMQRRVGELASLNNAVLVVALVIGGSWAWSTIEAIQRNFKLQQQVDALKQQIAVAELQNKSQGLQNKYYQSPEYLELSARERLGKAAPGEHVVILPPNKVSTAPETDVQTAETPITQRSNFAQWMYFLFGKKGS